MFKVNDGSNERVQIEAKQDDIVHDMDNGLCLSRLHLLVHLRGINLIALVQVSLQVIEEDGQIQHESHPGTGQEDGEHQHEDHMRNVLNFEHGIHRTTQ